MNALWLMLAALAVIAIAYRYYSAFLAARVLALDDSRPTPAHTMADGKNYVATNRYVLFGHHFAAIAGAGPLIGPVLAAQFGYAPGFLWLIFGVVFAGAVQDFVILAGSMRRGGRSLAEMARRELGPAAGATAGIAIFAIIIIALAGLGLAVTNALAESPWGTFTIAATIPIALLVGLYMYRWRPGALASGSAIGVVLTLAAVVAGRFIPGSSWEHVFTLTRTQITLAMAAYGFIASVLPVWMLLCPRDYLSSYMKLGTIAALVVSVLVVAPKIEAPAFSKFVGGGGPIIPGRVFPFVFITIACGAISGFHALIASGTTPKMISRETDARMIGYGAMLMEGLVGVVALIAVTALPPADYFAINLPPSKFAALGMQTVHLAELSRQVGESVAGRAGGAVSLAVGFARIFAGLPWLRNLMSYWYHFAIMFEALFILTTIDTGTRVGRFLVQELIGRVRPALGKTDAVSGTIVATLVVVGGWSYFILTGSISQIWPMFGIANQLLAAIALCVATTVILRLGRVRYIWVTLAPLAFVSFTTIDAGILSIRDNFLPMARQPGKTFAGWLDSGLTAVLIACVLLILAASLRAWLAPARRDDPSVASGADDIPEGCC